MACICQVSCDQQISQSEYILEGHLERRPGM